MSFSKILTLLSVVLILSCATVPVHTLSGDSSILVGSLKGTLHKPPHSFLGNSPQVGGDRGSIEFKVFRLIRKSDGKAFAIRPLVDSFFQQTLPAGEYDLVRKRRDRPSSKEDKSIRILTFTVPANSLVNLGTLEIVLEGPPDQSLFRASTSPKGTYIYHYRYERTMGADAMQAPLEWFSKNNPGVAEEYTGRVVEVIDSPTDTIDSSQFTLRERVFRILFD